MLQFYSFTALQVFWFPVSKQDIFAVLHSCEIVKLHNCKNVKLQNCRTIRLETCKSAKAQIPPGSPEQKIVLFLRECPFLVTFYIFTTLQLSTFTALQFHAPAEL